MSKRSYTTTNSTRCSSGFKKHDSSALRGKRRTKEGVRSELTTLLQLLEAIDYGALGPILKPIRAASTRSLSLMSKPKCCMHSS